MADKKAIKKPTLKRASGGGKAIATAQQTVTVRFSGETRTIPYEKGMTVSAAFRSQAGNLGLQLDKNLTARKDGFVVSPESVVEPGAAYMASVDRENKGA